MEADPQKFQNLRFCQECQNLLYADEEKIDDDARSLVYICRICHYQEQAEEKNEYDNCVYLTDLEAKEKELLVNPDIIDDPTLMKREIDKCSNPNKQCNNKVVVCFYHITKNEFSLVYVCTKCRYYWRQQERQVEYDINTDSANEENRKKFNKAD